MSESDWMYGKDIVRERKRKSEKVWKIVVSMLASNVTEF